MGTVGESYDTQSSMETVWSTLRIELVYRNGWRTRDQAHSTAARSCLS